MAVTAESLSLPEGSLDTGSPEEGALAWLGAGGIPDAEIEAICQTSSWTAEVHYRRQHSNWVLVCVRDGRKRRIVETPFPIEGVVALQREASGWAVTGTQAILPPELLCGDADLYIPGGAQRYDRILLSGHPERYGLHPRRMAVW